LKYLHYVFLSTIYVYYCVHYLNKEGSPNSNPDWGNTFRNKFFTMLVRLASIKCIIKLLQNLICDIM